MSITLWQDQREAVEFLMEGRRRILGDDVGLGKTFTAIEAGLRALEHPEVKFRNPNRPIAKQVLVIVPAHLIPQWLEMIEEYTEGRARAYVIYRGCPELPIQSTSDIPTFLITSHNTIQNPGRKATGWLWTRAWPCIIVDEAQAFRNPKARQFKNLQLLTGIFKILATGTPMENNPGDIWALLNLCDYRSFMSYHAFVDEWMVTVETPYKTEVVRVQQPKEWAFDHMVGRYMIRRTKSPESLVTVPVPIECPAGVQKDHDKALKSWRLDNPGFDLTKVNDPLYIASGGALVQELRQFMSRGYAGQAKLRTIGALCADLPRDRRHKLVFAWYRASAEFARDNLGTYMDADVYMVHGGMSADARHHVVKQWEASTHANPVLIGTIKSMSTGLNLQIASVAFFYEVDYLPGALKQATGRIDRRGQAQKHTLAYFITILDTVDDKVLRVAQGRERNILAALFESDQAFLPK
jgi:SNF2 family DNA or RNA helicase